MEKRWYLIVVRLFVIPNANWNVQIFLKTQFLLDEKVIAKFYFVKINIFLTFMQPAILIYS